MHTMMYIQYNTTTGRSLQYGPDDNDQQREANAHSQTNVNTKQHSRQEHNNPNKLQRMRISTELNTSWFSTKKVTYQLK